MLELRGIKKAYTNGTYTVNALRGINLAFREKEFVAILGPSGCGKTTLLNIIGGLDNYSEGDLRINGKSTKEYNARDWDQYRNHSIGFIFQSYNLIPHQNVLSNVALAMRISDESKEASQEKAKLALERVGLGEELYKRPNQVSGGQSQRVAISRALVSDPDIILADEPTGALDSVSSDQVMDILQEIAHEKLVIMVTHDEELAKRYADRIVRMKDGAVLDDTNPYKIEDETKLEAKSRKTAKMNWRTSFRLSLNNLWSKKGRTLLTAFAGSIGIIGIALIAALSNGIQTYINQVQEETLTAYPITIEKEAMDATGMLMNLMQQGEEVEQYPEGETVYSRDVMAGFLESMSSSSTVTNNMKDFGQFLENNSEMQAYASTIHYSYAIDSPIYTKAEDGAIHEVDIMEVMSQAFSTDSYQNQLMNQFSMMGQVDLFEELVTDSNGEGISPMYQEQYDLLTGHWPQEADEVVLVLNRQNAVPDMVLYALGMKDRAIISDLLTRIVAGEEIEESNEMESFTFDDFLNLELKLILPSEQFSKNSETGLWVDMGETETGKTFLYESEEIGMPLKVSGIIRTKEDASVQSINGSFAYSKKLTDYVMERNNNSEIMQEQQEQSEIDIFTNLPFLTSEYEEPSVEEKAEAFKAYTEEQEASQIASYYTWISAEPSSEELNNLVANEMSDLSREEIEENLSQRYAQEMQIDQEELRSYIQSMPDEELFSNVEELLRERIRLQYRQQALVELEQVPEEAKVQQFNSAEYSDEAWAMLYDEFMPPTVSENTYEDNLEQLGWSDPEEPEAIYLYANSFRDKDNISDLITSYNEGVQEDDKIQYTDYIALLMSSITLIIGGITYVLIAFVAISLVVSSVMIGIITYISVIERTKEIGILRALGASKKDVANVFNAETVVEGLASGILGIIVTLILILPINAIIQNLTQIEDMRAILPWQAAIILVIISTILTLIAGFIPSRMAAKMHPVDALRTE